MTRHLGQIVKVVKSRSDNLMINIKSNSPNISYIEKIGIQLPENKSIIIDKKEFQMGRTEKLEFDNVAINSSIYVKNKDNEENVIGSTPIIIDYIYIDKEE